MLSVQSEQLPFISSPTLGKQGSYSGERRTSRPTTSVYSSQHGFSVTAVMRLVKATLLRPFFILTRRGHSLPMIIVAIVLLCIGLSTISNGNSHTDPLSKADLLIQKGQMSQEQLLDVGEEDRLWEPVHDKMSPSMLEDVLVEHAHKPTPKRPKDGRRSIIQGRPHPIPRLIERAKARWANLNQKQSKTFAQAIAEYKRRYGRNPPRGFDQWYAFARANNVRMIDEFDLIERDLHPFRALSPSNLRARVNHLSNPARFDWTWGIRVQGGKIIREGQLAHHQRAIDVEALHKRFVHVLPDLLTWWNGHDNARIMIPWEERARLNELVANDLYDEHVDANFLPKRQGPFPHWGVPQVCPPDSAVRAPEFGYGEAQRSWTGLEMPPLSTSEKDNETVIGTVIDSFKGYMDVCNSPQYRHFHSTTSWVYPHHPTGLLPLFSPGVHSHYADIHALVVEQFSFESEHDPTWEERPFDRLVWRGQTSGPQWDQWSAWITSHRSRLHLLSHNEAGERSFVVTDDSDRATVQTSPNYQLNALFLDTGMVGPPVQCIGATCDEMKRVYNGFDSRLSFDRSNLYKYVLDVDGNSWSGRFRRLMLSNAAVFKATIYTEFWTDWAIPWLHFIPVQVDYSDLWDVVAFFRGDVNGQGAHDDLAREIALAGKDWAQKHFRWADLEAYQFRLMLEYARLWAQDRNEMDYFGDGQGVEPVWEEPGTMRRQPKRQETTNDDR